MERGKKSSSKDARWAAALSEMTREQSLVTQLRAVMLPALQLAGGDRAEVVASMFQSILNCSAKAISELKLLRPDNRCRDDDATVDDKRRVRKIVAGPGDDAKPHRKRRSRLADDSLRLETPVPDYDGHQWRKYGQKLISNAKHPRSYYRCTYVREQGCRATKTVQQQQQEAGGANDDPAKYAVVYYGQHTCKPSSSGTNNVAVVKTGSGAADELAPSDSPCSNILDTCTSVIVHHHHNLNSDLLDMAAYVADAEYDQLSDVAVFSPLYLDTDWATGAHAHWLLKNGDW
ncbi:unnamed protein product [Alopecurus aequalis]